MNEARMIYLFENEKIKDIGFGFEDGAASLIDPKLDRNSLYEQCIELSERYGFDFTLSVEENGENTTFRGRKITSSRGIVFGLREIHKGIPTLKDDYLGIPKFYKDLVSHPFLLKGGIILVAGSTGNGKSTTLAATMIHRIVLFGGVAVSIEDPPEYQMTCKVGKGFCFQVPVCEENGGDFPGAIKAALRFYPSGQASTILSIGEIRDGKTAATALRESINGHLVLTTIHANDVMSALTRILTLAGQEIGVKEAEDLLSQSLRMVAHQQLVNGKPSIKVLVNDGKNTLVSSRIRAGEIYSLNSEILRQNNLINKTGVLPLEGK